MLGAFTMGHSNEWCTITVGWEDQLREVLADELMLSLICNILQNALVWGFG